jgi:hypothetical protein
VGYEAKNGLLTVHVSATDKTGRKDEDYGVVSVQGLSGEAASNAFMKAVTKAKRRVTLSISGLGFSDEEEIESITPAFSDPGHGSIRHTPQLTKDSLPPKYPPTGKTYEQATREDLDRAPIEKAAEPVPYRIERRDGEDWGAWCRTMVAAMRSVPDVETIELIQAANANYVAQLFLEDREKHDKLADIIEHEKAKLNADGS